MPYEPGQYTKELKEAHRNGEHVENKDDNCPICNYRVVPEGFSSLEEYHNVCMEGAIEMQVHVDAHHRGEHTKPVFECIECDIDGAD